MNIAEFSDQIRIYKAGTLVKTIDCPNHLTFPYLKVFLLDSPGKFTIEVDLNGSTFTLPLAS